MIAKPRLLIVAVSLAMSASSFAADDLVLAHNGKALAPIIIPENAPGAVKFAASELPGSISLASRARPSR